MVRDRSCLPALPHDFVHVDQAVHSDSAQSTGQALVLHARVWSRTGHARPPWLATRVMVLRFDWTPAPHVAEHSDHAWLVQSLTAQSTGQAWALHDATSVSTGHAFPPNSIPVAMDRARDWVPVPHVTEQSL
jgi:hypothetical protein